MRSAALITPHRFSRPTSGRRPHWDDRIVARLLASWIDRDLAAGAASWSTVAHAARAVQLTGTRSRRSLARSLEQLVERAEEPPGPFRGAAIPPCRAQVRHALPALLTLAARLRGGAPIDARGIAQLRQLLCNGSGPCYAAICPEALTVALEEVSRGLDIQD
jgi:hypothetical protein